MKNFESNKVFISYSRKDRLFLDWLIERLTVEKIELYYDVRDIAPAEDWQQRISCLIREGEAFICIVSTHYQASKICRWELEEALINKKRIIPCVYDKDNLRIELDPEISKLNFVFFDDTRPSDRSFNQLLIALKLDVMWMREHTRLQNIAYRWDECGRPDYLLLNSPELIEVDEWIGNRSSYSSEITELQSDYFRKSRDINQKAEIELKRRIQSACKIVLTSQSMIGSYVREIDILSILESSYFLLDDNITDDNLPPDALMTAALTLAEISALTINTNKERSLKTAWRAMSILIKTYDYEIEDYHRFNIYAFCVDRLGESLFAHQKHSDALRIYRKSLYVAKRWLKNHGHSEYAKSVWNIISVFCEKISDIMHTSGQLHRADKFIRYALKVREYNKNTSLLNVSHRTIAILYEKIALIAFDEQKLEECSHYIYKSCEILDALTKSYSNHLGLKRDFAINIENISDLQSNIGIKKESYISIQKSLSVMNSTYSLNSQNFLWQGDLCRICSKYIIVSDQLSTDDILEDYLLKSSGIFDEITNTAKVEHHSCINWKAYIGFAQTIASSYRASNKSVQALKTTLQAIDVLNNIYILDNIDPSIIKSISNTMNNAAWYCIIENMPDEAFYLSKMAIEKVPENTSLYANYFLACAMSGRDVIANDDWHRSKMLCARFGKDLYQMLRVDLEELSNETSVLRSYILKAAVWLQTIQNQI